MDRLIKQFKESLENNIDSSLNVEVKIDIRMNGFSPRPVSGEDALAAGSSSVESENPQPWLERMDDFRGALQRVHQDLPDQGKGVDRVRVSITQLLTVCCLVLMHLFSSGCLDRRWNRCRQPPNLLLPDCAGIWDQLLLQEWPGRDSVAPIEPGPWNRHG